MAKRLRLSTPTEVRRTLGKIANLVYNGELDIKIANSLTVTCNAILNSIRLDDQQKRIEEIERILQNK